MDVVTAAPGPQQDEGHRFVAEVLIPHNILLKYCMLCLQGIAELLKQSHTISFQKHSLPVIGCYLDCNATDP